MTHLEQKSISTGKLMKGKLTFTSKYTWLFSHYYVSNRFVILLIKNTPSRRSIYQGGQENMFHIGEANEVLDLIFSI
ncbi:hypothetical protein Bca4012_027612 [Brassica carinata]